MVFHWRLSESKPPQVSRSLLSILAVFNSAVVWMISTRPPTSTSSKPYINPLATVPKAPITIGKIVTFMFHIFFNSLARSKYLALFSHSVNFILWSAGKAKSTNLQIFVVVVDYYKVWLRLGDLLVCQSPIEVCVCHFLGLLLSCPYTICWHGQLYISCTFIIIIKCYYCCRC